MLLRKILHSWLDLRDSQHQSMLEPYEPFLNIFDYQYLESHRGEQMTNQRHLDLHTHGPFGGSVFRFLPMQIEAREG